MPAADLTPHVEHAWQSVRLARISARLPRYLVCVALLVFSGLGLRAALFAPTATPALRPPAQADAPSEDLAMQFARAYLTYDSAHPGARARALAPYIGGGQLPADGFSPARGTQVVRWLDVASDQAALAGGRLITVAAAVSTQRLPLYLAVTVEHRPGQPLRLLGYPALVGAPAIDPAPAPPGREAVSDPALTVVIDRVLRNYLSAGAPDLRADLTPDAEVTLPTRRLRLAEVQQLDWLGGPVSGAVIATVIATDSTGATYTLDYELGIAYRERPYIDFIALVPTGS
jgi:hypothetical protein